MPYATTTALANEAKARKDADALLDGRLKKLEAAPTPLPGPTPVIWAFTGNAVQLSFLCADMTLDVIDCGGSVVSGSVNLRIARTKPLVVRNFILDGGGSATPPIRLGTLSGQAGVPTVPTSYISFEDGALQNYVLGKDGAMMTGWVDTVAFRRITVRNVRGSQGTGSFSHVLYVQSDGTHRGRNVLFEDISATLDKTMNLAQLYASGGPGVDGVTLRRVSGSGGHTALYAYSNSTGILVEDCAWTDFDQTIETGETPQGVVKGCKSIRSGPLAPGQGRWAVGGLVDGGGNVVTA